jgi:uncharacterized phiE125 gp8 family phage protein
MKTWLRIESGETAEDDLLYSLIEAARERAESITNRKYMPETWYYYLDAWPTENYITLPYAPLRYVGSTAVASTGIYYTDSTGNSTTYNSAASSWTVDIASVPGRIVRGYNESAWPTVTLAANNPIRIEVHCGYAGSSKVPSRVKTAIKLMVGHWYENREDAIVGQGLTIQEIPLASHDLLKEFRVYQF